MSQVNVTRDALEQTKVSLQNFQINMEEIPRKMVQHIELSYQKCEAIIYELQEEIDELSAQIHQLKAYIATLQEQLKNVKTEIQIRQEHVNQLERQIDQLEGCISYNEQQIRSLQASNVEGRNNYANASLEQECGRLRGQIHSCQVQINQERYQIEQLTQRRYSLEQENSICEASLRDLTYKKERKQDKMCRLKSAYYCVQNTCDQLKSMLQNFQYEALVSTSGNIAGIDQCFYALEEYLSV